MSGCQKPPLVPEIMNIPQASLQPSPSARYNIQICIGICIAPYIRIQTKEQAQSENTGKQDCGSSEKCSQRRRSFYKIAVIEKYIV